jgi:5'-3' exonuclease
MADGRKKLAIIDGKSVFYRGYYAMPGLSTKDGTPTGGVYGFAVMALEVIKRLKPDYVCVAWDKPKTNIRRRLELYPEYKAGRKPPPPDFYTQIPMLHELLEAFGWPLYEFDDYEADDIMGTLAVKAAKQDIETMLITSDMDMLQLVDPHVHVFALKKGLSILNCIVQRPLPLSTASDLINSWISKLSKVIALTTSPEYQVLVRRVRWSYSRNMKRSMAYTITLR